MTMTLSNPSLNTYKHLYDLYQDTLKCPCSNMVMPYHTIVSMSPTFHQVCSSSLVTDIWISAASTDEYASNPNDWRLIAGVQFRLLSSLCKLVETTVNDAINNFVVQSFTTSNVLNEDSFNAQLNETFNQLIESTNIRHKKIINTMKLFMEIDQPFGGVYGDAFQSTNAQLQFNYDTNETNEQQFPQLKFIFSGLFNSTFGDCICATNFYCQAPSKIYDLLPYGDYGLTTNVLYPIPGMFAGCFPIDSLFYSTLECFYSSSSCLPILFSYMKQVTTDYSFDTDYAVPQALIYDPVSSRFPPNTTISAINEELMIEKWNISYSFNIYYEKCLPSYCTYSYKAHTKNFLGILVTMISMIGGLTVVLRLITPQLVKSVYYMLGPTVRRQEQGNRR
ncbi:unnamed protein product [Adineta steineri]|uniref:Uncharacterized protein n=1 Tax=Adineta steineri TaxID=433720 RepID=A0A815DI55_9BILA|nr:unnamed protein product [Adineta steineri]CAF1297405.1 unnamed protein product [Adineta steineri]CAF3932072.1 unnamed protein product [Adineta steineri]CAF4044422.1 unnamed protein product [Adineta steineri]